MVWKSVGKKTIGTVVIKKGGPTPPPTPPIIQSFLAEHRKLKDILDKYGSGGACVPRSVLERESGVSGEQLDRHIRVFTDSDAASPITEEGEEVLCGKSALRELKKKLEVEL